MGNGEVLERVRSLLAGEGRQSRNQGFAEFSDREGQEVMRLYRLYVSLAQELRAAAERPDVRVLASRQEGGLRLEVRDPKVSYRRSCHIPPSLVGHFLKVLAQMGPRPAGPGA